MLFIAAIMMGWQRPPPDDLMRTLIGHYQKLKSYSAKVIHHGDFLSDVRDSTDTLVWLAPKRFEIVSDKQSMPKLCSDGKKLTTYIPDVAPISELLEQGSSRIPTWSTRGGLVLTLLMKSTFADQLLRPAKPVKVSFTYGSALRWHDIPVSEIKSVLTVNGMVENISYYLTPDYKQLIGIEITSGSQSAWTEFKDAIENPVVTKTLGDLPGSQQGI